MRLNSELVGPGGDATTQTATHAEGRGCAEQGQWARYSCCLRICKSTKFTYTFFNHPTWGRRLSCLNIRDYAIANCFVCKKGATSSTCVWLAESIQHRRCKLLCQRCISPPRHHASIVGCIEFRGIGVEASSKCCYVVILTVRPRLHLTIAQARSLLAVPAIRDLLPAALL